MAQNTLVDLEIMTTNVALSKEKLNAENLLSQNQSYKNMPRKEFVK